MWTSIKHALSNFCTTSPFPSVNLIFFFNLNVLIFCVRTKDSLINSAPLPLSMSNRVFIPAMLALNTRCLPSIFGTSSCIAHAEILARLVVETLLIIASSDCCPWLRFRSKTKLFPIQSHWPLQLGLLSHSTQLSYWSMDSIRCFHGDQTLCIPSTFLVRGAWHAHYLGVFVGMPPDHTTFLPSRLVWCWLE